MASRTTQWRERNQEVLNIIRSAGEEVHVQNEVINSDISMSQSEDTREHNFSHDDFDMSGNDSPMLLSNSDDDIPSEDGDHHQRNSDKFNKFNSDIAEWAIRFNVNHSTLNGLMQILRCHVSEDLPCDARTVLKTKRTVAVARKSGGEYTYIGIRQAISKQPINFDTTKISLIVNIDGLPLFKSSDLQVWPILEKLETGNPFIIALFCGSGKPDSVEEFMEDFLKEYKHLSENGIVLNDKVKSFAIECFTCDAPARQMLKSIKGHTGYSSCERCSVVGEQCSKTMTFMIQIVHCALMLNSVHCRMPQKILN